MIQLNKISELRQHLDANRGKPIVIGLPPRFELDEPLNIAHDADITLRSDNTEIVGEQFTVTSSGTVTFEGLAHFGASEWDDKRKADYIRRHTNLGAINGRGLSAFARRLVYRDCTILNCLDDGWGGRADEIIVERCLFGHSWMGDKAGLVTNTPLFRMSQSVIVGARYRAPVKLDNVGWAEFNQCVVVGNWGGMEWQPKASGAIVGCWFAPEPMANIKPLRIASAYANIMCHNNYVGGKPSEWHKVVGNVRGLNDDKNRVQFSGTMRDISRLPSEMDADIAGKIIDSAGAPVVNELTILARRMAREMGGL